MRLLVEGDDEGLVGGTERFLHELVGVVDDIQHRYFHAGRGVESEADGDRIGRSALHLRGDRAAVFLHHEVGRSEAVDIAAAVLDDGIDLYGVDAHPFGSTRGVEQHRVLGGGAAVVAGDGANETGRGRRRQRQVVTKRLAGQRGDLRLVPVKIDAGQPPPGRNARLHFDDRARDDAIVFRRDDADAEGDSAVVQHHLLLAELLLLRIPGDGAHGVDMRRAAKCDFCAEGTLRQLSHARVVEKQLHARCIVRGGYAEVDTPHHHLAMRIEEVHVAGGDVRAHFRLRLGAEGVEMPPRRLSDRRRLRRGGEGALIGIDRGFDVALFATDMPEENPGTRFDVLRLRVRHEIFEHLDRLPGGGSLLEVDGGHAELRSLRGNRILFAFCHRRALLEDPRGIINKTGIEQTAAPDDGRPRCHPLAAQFRGEEERRRLLAQCIQLEGEFRDVVESVVRLEDDASPRIEHEQAPALPDELREIGKRVGDGRRRRRGKHHLVHRPRGGGIGFRRGDPLVATLVDARIAAKIEKDETPARLRCLQCLIERLPCELCAESSRRKKEAERQHQRARGHDSPLGGTGGGSVALDPRYPHHLFETRHTLGQLAQRGLTQRAHAAFDGHVFDLEEVFGAVDEVADGVVDGKDLEDAGAAEVAGVAAADAAGAFFDDDPFAGRGLQVEHAGLLHAERAVAFAVFADAAHEPLRHRADERRRDEKGLDTEVDQARDRRRRIVGVQRRENEVAGQRGLNGILRGFLIANLADHDDVGILAEDRSQRGRKGDADLCLHRGLIELVPHHLDRIFDGGDVDLGRCQRLERRIERDGLARSRRAGDEDDAVRALDPFREGAQLVLVKPESGQVADEDFGVEDAHDQLFAEGGGERGDAQFDLFSFALGLDPSVLRAALFGDVHAAHGLEARGDGQVDELRHALDLVQHAVDAEADHGRLALRLDVDVAGSRVEGMLQKEVDGVDDVRVAGLDLVARLELDVLLEVGEIDGAAPEVASRFRHRGPEAVLLGDHAHDVALRRHHDLDLLLHHLVVGVESDGVEGIDDGDDELAVADGHGRHAVFARERARDLRLDHLHVELERIDLEEFKAGVFGDETGQQKVVHARAGATGVGEVHGHEGLERAGFLLAARARGARLRAKLAIEVVDLELLLVVDEAGVLQQLAEVRKGDLARLTTGCQ